MRYATIAAFAAGLFALSGCGPNPETRAVTGAATGLAVAGPVGAAAGAGLGATGTVRVNP